MCCLNFMTKFLAEEDFEVKINLHEKKLFTTLKK
jgi:hypothetical protein